MRIAKLLCVPAVAAGLVAGMSAPADAGVVGCSGGLVSDTNVTLGFSLNPLVVSPGVSLPDGGAYANCLLDTVGLCVFEYDPVGPFSQGLVPETETFAGCLTS